MLSVGSLAKAVTRTGNAAYLPRVTASKRCTALPGGIGSTQIRCISIENGQVSRIWRVWPFPYEDLKFSNWFKYLGDNTVFRFNSDTLFIQVDGLPGTGKQKFAKELAETLDYKYIPPTDVDIISYGKMNEFKKNGADPFEMNKILPQHIRRFGMQEFFTADPDKIDQGKAMYLCRDFIMAKLYTHYDAMNHLLQTGQGVVVAGSFHSSLPHIKAMYQQGYLNSPMCNYLIKHYKVNLNEEVLVPHLTIFLDAPDDPKGDAPSIEALAKSLNTDGERWEQNSQVLTAKYLRDMDNSYKKDVLPDLKYESNVLAYPYEQGDYRQTMPDVLLDMEKLDFLQTREEHKFRDWKSDIQQGTQEYERYRIKYQNTASIPESLLIYDSIRDPILIKGANIKGYNEAEFSEIIDMYIREFNPKMKEEFWLKKLVRGLKTMYNHPAYFQSNPKPVDLHHLEIPETAKYDGLEESRGAKEPRHFHPHVKWGYRAETPKWQEHTT